MLPLQFLDVTYCVLNSYVYIANVLSLVYGTCMPNNVRAFVP